MRIGVPKEIKVLENRVGLTPESVREVVAHGHEVVVERDAGRASAWRTTTIGARAPRCLRRPPSVFAGADMIVKVKEPQAEERRMLRAGQMLFTYLHLAPDPEQARELIASGAVCIAYETVTSPDGRLAAARADVGSRRAHGGAGGRALPRESARRQGHAARRRARRRPGARSSCSAAASSARTRSTSRSAWAPTSWVLDRSVDVLRALWTQFGRPLQHGVFDTRCDRAARRDGRPRHRRRARPRRRGAEARHARDDREA